MEIKRTRVKNNKKDFFFSWTPHWGKNPFSFHLFDFGPVWTDKAQLGPKTDGNLAILVAILHFDSSSRSRKKQWKEDRTHCLKITQNVALKFLNFGIFHQFCPIKTDLSGNTV